jgi:uncharacterized integral membrane protein
MRYIYATLTGLFTVVVVLFSLQNLGNVTISFLTMGATLPLALLVIGVYICGMVTGGFVLALLRSWIHGARRK